MIRASISQTLLLVLGLFCLAASSSFAQSDSPLEKAKTQFFDFTVGRAGAEPTPSRKSALSLAKSQKADGSWADLDYSSTARSAWQPSDHCARMVTMAAVATGAINLPAEDRDLLLAATHHAFHFWMQHDFQCPNWWYNQIGIPKLIGTCALLLGDKLASDEFAYAAQTSLARYGIGMTGQNKVWLAGNAFMLGLLKRDEAAIDHAAATIWNEVRVTTEEGIQPDYSFHQHGPQQQFGNYGLAFCIEICRWATILRETPWAMPKNKLEIFRHFLLDGENWTCWRGAMDVSACGRQLMPGFPIAKAKDLARCMTESALFDPEFGPTYLTFVTRNRPGARNGLIGNKYFWRSDYVVQRSADFAATLKMSSNRVIGGETVNSENLAGYHLADGALYFYRDGGEYADIFSVWDWRRIPGTTCNAMFLPKFKTVQVKTDFVGGVSDGLHGCAALDYARDGVEAKKAWFFSGNAVVCLGSGITGDYTAGIVTTVNQCLLRGAVKVKESGAVLSFGGGEETVLSDVTWIEHDGWHYDFPSGGAVRIMTGPVTGNWDEVYANPQTPKADVTKDLLLIGLEHGNSPRNASYAYVVSPIGGKAHAEILVNSPTLQAVKMKDNLYGLVFWTGGRIDLPGELALSVDQPCIVLVDAKKQKAWLADPTQKLSSIRMKAGGIDVTIDLPSGGEAGRTVETLLTQRVVGN